MRIIFVFAYYIKHNNPPASVYNIEKWKYIGFIYAIFLVVLSIYSIILVIQS